MGLALKTGLIALMILGACADGTGGSGGFGLIQPKPAPKQVTISGTDVIIAGPKGFCIDPTTPKTKSSNAFVLLGSCAAISNSIFKPRPEIPAILTAAVSKDTQSGSVADSMVTLASFFKSEAGRAALSRDGKAETVKVIEILGKDGVLFIHALDNSTDTLAGAGAEYWRALFDVKGRIVSASTFGLEKHPFSSKAGFETLDAFARRIIDENTSSAAQKKDPV